MRTPAKVTPYRNLTMFKAGGNRSCRAQFNQDHSPTPPWRYEIVLYAKLIEYPGHDKINEVLNATGLVVKAGHGRKDYRSRFRSLEHVCEVDAIERRFAGDKNERAAFLQADVGRPVDEILRQPGGNRSQAPIVHGTITMPAHGNEPLANGAAKSVSSYVQTSGGRSSLSATPVSSFVDEPSRLGGHEVNVVLSLGIERSSFRAYPAPSRR